MSAETNPTADAVDTTDALSQTTVRLESGQLDDVRLIVGDDQLVVGATTDAGLRVSVTIDDDTQPHTVRDAVDDVGAELEHLLAINRGDII